MIKGKIPQILLVAKFLASSIANRTSWGGLLLRNGNPALRRAFFAGAKAEWVKLPVEEATPSMAETVG